MGSDGGGWIAEWSQKVLSWFSQREVKTPLAFNFRLVHAVVLIVLAGLFLAPAERRFEIIIIGLVALVFPGLVVTLFTAFNVKNLVYGESSHRAELKLRLGTEKQEF